MKWLFRVPGILACLRPSVALVGVGMMWLLSVGAGLAFLVTYQKSPGVAATPPSRWPADSRIERLPGTPVLVVFIHPRCPCSRASIEELDRLMARSQGLLTARVLFLKPSGVVEGWEKTDLWRSAEAIRGVSVARDDDGLEARRFGSATSGQAILYDADGQLLFSGGITLGRGHTGDNPGRSTIVALLTEGRGTRRETPVFGCSLADPNTSVPGWRMSDGS
jgi:hypothetical protein